MTALKKYTRLESTGLWFESPTSEPMEVLVSLGKSTVVLYDYEDTPLTHWSLATIKLISKTDLITVFSTTQDGLEKLEIDDKHMTEALLNFINNPAKTVSNNKLLRRLLILSFLFSILSLFLIASPRLTNLVETIISDHHQIQLVEPYLDKYLERNGPVCASLSATTVLENILLKLGDKDKKLNIKIIKKQNINAIHLPGGTLLISNQFFQRSDTASPFLNILKAELLNAENRTPLKNLIGQQSTYNLIKFVLGLETTFSIHSIRNFRVDTSDVKYSNDIQLDDFSWVTLQNACLN